MWYLIVLIPDLCHITYFDSLKRELRSVKEDFVLLQPNSTNQALWDKLQTTVTDLMKKYTATLTLNGKEIKRPWVNRNIRSQMCRIVRE